MIVVVAASRDALAFAGAYLGPDSLRKQTGALAVVVEPAGTRQGDPLCGVDCLVFEHPTCCFEQLAAYAEAPTTQKLFILSQDKVITDWSLVPVRDGGVVIMGQYNGASWQTTEVASFKHGHPGQVIATTKNSVYTLINQRAGMWRVPLQMRRPELFGLLTSRGIL